MNGRWWFIFAQGSQARAPARGHIFTAIQRTLCAAQYRNLCRNLHTLLAYLFLYTIEEEGQGVVHVSERECQAGKRAAGKEEEGGGRGNSQGVEEVRRVVGESGKGPAV